MRKIFNNVSWCYFAGFFLCLFVSIIFALQFVPHFIIVMIIDSFTLNAMLLIAEYYFNTISAATIRLLLVRVQYVHTKMPILLCKNRYAAQLYILNWSCASPTRNKITEGNKCQYLETVVSIRIHRSICIICTNLQVVIFRQQTARSL